MCQHLLPKQRWLPENSCTHLVVSLRNLDEMISYTATDVAVFNTHVNGDGAKSVCLPCNCSFQAEVQARPSEVTQQAAAPTSPVSEHKTSSSPLRGQLTGKIPEGQVCLLLQMPI